MPAKTAKQYRFMGMASSPEGREILRKKGFDLPPTETAKEYVKKTGATLRKKFAKSRG
jgi:hypothetical protein